MQRIQEFKPKNREASLLKRIHEYQADALIRKGTFCTEIIFGCRSFVFAPTRRRRTTAGEKQDVARGLYLYNMVRRDAKKFLKHNEVRLPKKYPVNFYPRKYKGRKITGTDFKHAYWRIAYLLEIISKNTYERGLDKDFKSVRLSTLSTLGAGKEYNIISNGIKTNRVKKIGGNAELQEVYKLIRYTCYKFMQKIMNELGDEFVGYRTDCIYYMYNKKNRNKVVEFCKKNDLLYQHLRSEKNAVKSK